MNRIVRDSVGIVSVVAALFLSSSAYVRAAEYGGSDDKTMQNASQQGGVNAPAQANQPVIGSKRVSGTIRSIDPATRTVTVKGLLLSKTFTCDTAASLGSFQVGDKVEVNYHQQGNSLIADQINPKGEGFASTRGNQPSRMGEPTRSSEPSPSSSESSPQSTLPTQ